MDQIYDSGMLVAKSSPLRQNKPASMDHIPPRFKRRGIRCWHSVQKFILIIIKFSFLSSLSEIKLCVLFRIIYLPV